MPRPKRAHGHKSAPTGGTSGANPDDTQPVDPAYGARDEEVEGEAAPYYPHGEQLIGGAYQEGQEVQDESKVSTALYHMPSPASDFG